MDPWEHTPGPATQPSATSSPEHPLGQLEMGLERSSRCSSGSPSALP